MNRFATSLLLGLVALGCASTTSAPTTTLTFPTNVNEASVVEIYLEHRGAGRAVSCARAEASQSAGPLEAARILTSFRLTLFDDINGNSMLDEGDRELGHSFGQTDRPSRFIEISGVKLPPGTDSSRAKWLAEVGTIHGEQKSVLQF